VRTQGRRGEVAAELHTDLPERSAERKRIFALTPEGSRRELRLESFWPHLGRYVLSFGNVESIGEAEKLVGCELQIRREERTRLESGSAYVGELTGCTFWAGVGHGEVSEIGTISDVQFGAGEAPLLVVRSNAREYLVPFAQEYLRGIDLAGRRVKMQLPEGMLELDAPLSEEEKRWQASGRLEED